MNISERFRRTVRRLEECQEGPSETEDGLEQFYQFESSGEWPEHPDPYFFRLWNGKRWWEWTVNSIALRYGTKDWCGWDRLKDDFRDDVDGFKQIVDRVAQKWNIDKTGIMGLPISSNSVN